MISLSMLKAALGGHLTRCCCPGRRESFPPEYLLLLSPEEEPGALPETGIYAGEPEEIIRLLREKGCGDRALFFSAGDHPELEETARDRGAALCVSDLPLPALHNRLSRALALYRGWQRRLEGQHLSLNDFLERGSELTQGSLLLLNRKRKLMSCVQRQEHISGLRELIDWDQVLVEEAVRPIFEELEDGREYACHPLGEALSLYAAPVGGPSHDLGYLLVVSGLEAPSLVQRVLQLALSAAALLAENDAGDEGTISFQDFAAALLLGEAPNLDALQLQLPRLPTMPKQYMRGILVWLGEEARQDKEPFMAAARALFQTKNVADLGGQVFILVTGDYSTCPLPCTGEKLNALLERYGAHAVIGNPAKRAKTLRIMYLQCKALYEVVMKVRYHVSDQFFYFERFSQYYVIDLCARHLAEELGTDDITYLCHPGVLAVTRYDRTYNSDLRDVMFNYLMNRCSISRTAQSMFMHRNTVTYKVGKIEEILGASMDDAPYLQQALIFSCQLVRYREEFQNQTIALSAFKRTTPQI